MAIRSKKGVAEKLLDVDAGFQGSLSFRDPVNLRINGRFEGKLEAKGNLIIGQTAIVEAQILGENITVAGRVKGSIKADKRLTLVSPAKVIADIRTPKLVVEEGAMLEGNCRMVGEVFNAEELSRYLEIESSQVVEWASSGKIPAFKEGNDWRFERAKVDEWLSTAKMK